jgi:anti-sigma factor RsiW
VLLSRAVDGTLSNAEWSALEAHAATHPALWRELCLLHRDDLALRAALAHATTTRAPGTTTSDTSAPLRLALEADAHQPSHNSSANSARAWMGWAAAAVFGLVAAISLSSRTGPLQTTLLDTHANVQIADQQGTQSASLLPSFSLSQALQRATPEQLLSSYIAQGREQGSVFGVHPERVVLHTTPLEDGKGLEVYYIRPIIERAHINALTPITPTQRNPNPGSL